MSDARKKKTSPKSQLPIIGVRFEPNIRKIIDKLAKDDMRPKSAWIEKIVIDYLKNIGEFPDGIN